MPTNIQTYAGTLTDGRKINVDIVDSLILVAVAGVQVWPIVIVPDEPPVPPPLDAPRVGNGRLMPAQPNFPSNNAIKSYGLTTNVNTMLDFAGATIVDALPNKGSTLFYVNGKNAAVKRARIQGQKDRTTLFDVSAESFLIEDVDFLDNSFELCIVRSGGRKTIMRRVTAKSFARYFCFAESATDVLLEDCTIQDNGLDGLPDTADDDGGSNIESVVRGGGCSVTLRRVRVIYRGASRKACGRGDTAFYVDDCFFDGAVVGWNKLNEGDGGRGWLIDRVLTNKIQMVSNPDVTRKAVMAAAVTEHDPVKLALVFRNAGKIWVDDADHSKGEVALSTVMNTTNHITQSIAQRRKDIEFGSRAVHTKTTINFGYAAEYGSDSTFDDSCVIRATKDNASNACISIRGGVYPPVASGSDVGWTLPYDSPYVRGLAILRLNGTRLYGKTISTTTNDTEARKYIFGKFYFNDVLYDWSANTPAPSTLKMPVDPTGGVVTPPVTPPIDPPVTPPATSTVVNFTAVAFSNSGKFAEKKVNDVATIGAFRITSENRYTSALTKQTIKGRALPQLRTNNDGEQLRLTRVDGKTFDCDSIDLFVEGKDAKGGTATLVYADGSKASIGITAFSMNTLRTLTLTAKNVQSILFVFNNYAPGIESIKVK